MKIQLAVGTTLELVKIKVMCRKKDFVAVGHDDDGEVSAVFTEVEFSA